MWLGALVCKQAGWSRANGVPSPAGPLSLSASWKCWRSRAREGKGRGKGRAFAGGNDGFGSGTGRNCAGPVAGAGVAADLAPCSSISTLPPGLQQVLIGAAPATPPMPLREEPRPKTLAPLQRSLQLRMDSIARLDPTIHALCLRRAQVQAAVVAELLCLFEVLAQHTRFGFILMQGSANEAASATIPTPVSLRFCLLL